MSRKEIEFVLPKRNIRLSAQLLEDKAPETCRAVWSVLDTSDKLRSVETWPERGLVRHGRYAGPEIFLFIPTGKKKPQIENQTFRPIPGDVLFFTVTSLYPGLRESGLRGELWEIALFYDRNSDLEVKHAPGVEGIGWIGSRFAKVPDQQLEKLLDVGNKIWLEGAERAVVRRKR